MRILGLDLGAQRIGIAISDPGAAFAFPDGTLQSHGRARDVEALASLIAEREIARVVVGLPLNMDGRAGPAALAAQAFASALHTATGVPVDTLDERWTTVEAQRALRDTGRAGRSRRTRKARKGEVDAVAATIILRTYLERRDWTDESVEGREA